MNKFMLADFLSLVSLLNVIAQEAIRYNTIVQHPEFSFLRVMQDFDFYHSFSSVDHYKVHYLSTGIFAPTNV